MTTLYLFDAAYAPSAAAVKKAGGIAVNCYLTGMYQDTTSDPATARAAGLGVLLTYEEGRSELVNAGRGDGQVVGRKILAALERENAPLDGSLAVYPSVDVSVAAADACDAAWRGLRDVLHGKVSLRYYGEGRVGDHLFDAGLLDGKYWLAAPASWPGYDGTSDTKRVCLVQQVGSPVGGTDRNIITDVHALGAWWPENSPYAQGDDVSAADVITALKSADGQALLKQAVASVPHDVWAYEYPKGSGRQALSYVLTAANPDGLAAAILQKLPAGEGGLTKSDVEAAVRAVFADAGNAP